MSKLNQYVYASKPIMIGGKMQLKNRITISPHMSGLSTADGLVTEAMTAYYARLARGGAALVTVGDSSVGDERSKDHLTALDVGNPLSICGLASVVDEVHRYGAKISIELSHAGVQANAVTLNGKKPIGPSEWPRTVKQYMFGQERPAPEIEAMSRKDLVLVKQQFMDAVGRCADAGFDAVIIHLGHGWLLSLFVSPVFNQRTDEYGGSFDNRCRYPVEVMKAIREAHGDRIAIGMRVTGNTRVREDRGEPSEDELIEFAKRCAEYADWCNVSVSWGPYEEGVEYMCQSYYHPHKVNAEFAKRMKAALPIPVAATGSITTIAEAEDLLREEWCDLVAITRGNIAADNLVNDAFCGQEHKSRPCIRCTCCTVRMIPPAFRGIRCTVNPTVGHELEQIFASIAPRRKRVLVVGGGPAGMQAAQTAIARGHDVVLYEKSDTLGGMLHTAAALSDKYDMRRYAQWMVDETYRVGVKVVLSTEVTPDLILRHAPDAVIVAVGSRPAWPKIKGLSLDTAYWAGDVDSGKVIPVGKIVIAGAGLTGAECAIELARQGKRVTLIDRISASRFVADAAGPCIQSIRRLHRELEIKTIFNATITEIRSGGVEYIDTEGNLHFAEADTIVNALGMSVDTKLVDSLMGIVPETYVVGDANGKAKSIMNATESGYTCAMLL